MNIDNSEIKISDFDKETGKRYSQDYLERVFPEIAFWPTPTMAKCVDVVTFLHVNQNDPIVVHDSISQEELSMANATSFGNLAYISLYHPNKEIGRKAQRLINELRVKLHQEITGTIQKFQSNSNIAEA